MRLGKELLQSVDYLLWIVISDLDRQHERRTPSTTCYRHAQVRNGLWQDSVDSDFRDAVPRPMLAVEIDAVGVNVNFVDSGRSGAPQQRATQDQRDDADDEAKASDSDNNQTLRCMRDGCRCGDAAQRGDCKRDNEINCRVSAANGLRVADERLRGDGHRYRGSNGEFQDAGSLRTTSNTSRAVARAQTDECAVQGSWERGNGAFTATSGISVLILSIH